MAPSRILDHVKLLVTVEHGTKVRYLGIESTEQDNWQPKSQEQGGKRRCWNLSCIAECELRLDILLSLVALVSWSEVRSPGLVLAAARLHDEPARCLHSGTAGILGLFQQGQDSSLPFLGCLKVEAFWNI